MNFSSFLFVFLLHSCILKLIESLIRANLSLPLVPSRARPSIGVRGYDMFCEHAGYLLSSIRIQLSIITAISIQQPTANTTTTDTTLGNEQRTTTWTNTNRKKNEERLTDIKMQTENTEHFQCKSISESTSICIYDEYIIRFTVYIYHIMCCYCCLLYDGTIRWRVRGRKRERENRALMLALISTLRNIRKMLDMRAWRKCVYYKIHLWTTCTWLLSGWDEQLCEYV